MIKNVLLDWSGTLADDLGPVLEATNRIFEHYGRQPVSRDWFRREFRLPFSGFYSEHLPEATAEGLEQLYERFFLHLNDHVELLPGALNFLEFCRRTGRRTFLLSTIKSSHFDRQAKRLGVLDFFEVAYVQIHDKREKIREMLTDHDLRPEETVFVGDMVHDIETARHGGVLGVAVLTGFDPVEKLLPANPPIICQSLKELQYLL